MLSIGKNITQTEAIKQAHAIQLERSAENRVKVSLHVIHDGETNILSLGTFNIDEPNFKKLLFV